MRLVIITLSLCLAYPVMAEDNKPIPPEVIEKLAKDLSKMQPTGLDPKEHARAAMGLGAAILEEGLITITAPSAQIYSMADLKAAVVNSAQRGDAFPFSEAIDNWYKVQLAGGGAGWVRSADALPTKMRYLGIPSNDPNWFERRVADLLRKAANLKNTYRNNPHVNIKGFSIALSIPPSLNIDFEFK